LVAQMKDLALMKQGETQSEKFPQGDINATAFLPTGHSVAGDQKGRVALFSPRLNAGETPHIQKVYTNSRWIEVLNEDEDDWQNATRKVKVFVPITALLPWIDVGGKESEMVEDLGPIAKKCNQLRTAAYPPKVEAKASFEEDEEEEPEPQRTPSECIDDFFNHANAQTLIQHVQLGMEHQLEVDLPKTDDGPSTSMAANADTAPANTTTDSAASGQKKPNNAHLVIGDDHGRVRVIKLALGKSTLKPAPPRSKMHPYAGEVDIGTAVLKKSEKDRQEKKHLYYEEVKEQEPKIVIEWEAHPHSAITHMEEVVGVNGLLTCGEDAYVRMWNCDIGSKHAGELLCSIDTKKRFAHSWSMPTVLSQSYLLMCQGYRVLERIYGSENWEKRSKSIYEARTRASLALIPSQDLRKRQSETMPRAVVQQKREAPKEDSEDPWKKVQRDGRYFKMMDLEEISELERIAKEEHDQSLKVAQMITPNMWQPKNVEIQMTQKPLDPYAAFERKPADSPTPEHLTTIRGALSLIDREGRSIENLPGAFRMPLPLALNSVEEAAQQDRISRKQRRRFSAKREAETRVSLGVQQMNDEAPVSQQKQHLSVDAARVNDEIKPVKCTTMYQTFELSQSMQDFHRSYKRQLNHSKLGDSSKVFGSTAQSLMTQSMTNFSSTRSGDQMSGFGSLRSSARDTSQRSHATRSGPTLGTPSTVSRDSLNMTDHKSFNAVSGRDHNLSGRDVRFRIGEGQRVMGRATRHAKSPT
jgi:hypothetical protein